MQRKLSIFILFILAFIFFGQVRASTISSTNKLNPATSKYELVGENYQSIGHFKVTGGDLVEIDEKTEYFLIPTYLNKRVVTDFNWKELPYFDETLPNKIDLFDKEKEFLEPVQLTKKLYADGIHVGYAIEVDASIGYFRINELNLKSNSITKVDVLNFFSENITSIDQALLLIKASDIKFLPSPTNYVYQYSNTSYDVSNMRFNEELSTYSYGKDYADIMEPIIEVDRLKFETTVDNPITIPNLMKEINLFAYDEIDGNLTSQIQYNCDIYFNNVLNIDEVRNRVLGEYDIEFFVLDSSSNKASCIVNIIVVDNLKPVVDYDKSVINYTFEVFKVSIDKDYILSNIIVSDNYSHVSYIILKDTYLGNEDLLGSYEVHVRFSDESKNYTDVIVTINIVDITAPTINVLRNYYNVSYRVKKNISDVLTELKLEIIDNYDRNLNYEITKNDYSGNENKVGSYIFKIKCIDNSGNFNEYEFRMNVIDDVAPIIYFNRTKVKTTTNEFLTMEKIKHIIITESNPKSENFELEIVKDTYTVNSNRKGEYEMGLRLIYEDGTVEYELLKINVEKGQSTGFFAKAIVVIKKIFLFIWNIIKWPFEWLYRLIF